ncbi:MAG: lipoprotein [Burkholderiaceae bacterium]|nr:lipoprotein [Burkholderiaceae bacterium]
MAALITVGLMLSGCGQKGPLTLVPKAKPPSAAPAPTPRRAATGGTMSAIPPDPAASSARPWGSPPR